MHSESQSVTRTPSRSGKEQLIKVCVRLKPMAKELERGQQFWQIREGRHIFNLRTKDSFTFDRAFPPNTTTAQIFHKEVKDLVSTTMKGQHSTVFAYGQTSSGKTFTMRGDQLQDGLIPQSIEQVFRVIEEHGEVMDYEVHISYVQIYNEQLRDLLPSQGQFSLTGRGLQIRESIKKGVFIKGLCLHRVYSVTDTLQKLQNIDQSCSEEGDRNRTFAETKLNTRSSRSHTIFRVHVKSTEKKSEDTERGIYYKEAILSLVDLAGSEGVNRANTEGLRLRECSNINKSLLALSNVIHKLSQKSAQQQSSSNNVFINFRDSKLTRILQPSLQGSSKTCILCLVSQQSKNDQQTVNTLKFGWKAMNIKPSVKINQMNFFTDHTLYSHAISNGKLREALLEIEGLRQAIEVKDKRINSLEITNKKQEKEIKDNISDLHEEAEQKHFRATTTSVCSSGLFTPQSQGYEVPKRQVGRHQKQNSMSSSSSNSRRIILPESGEGLTNRGVRPFELNNDEMTPYRPSMAMSEEASQLKERIRYLEKQLAKKDEDLRHALQISTYLQQEIEQTYEANRILQGENQDLRQEQSDMMELLQEAEKNERLVDSLRKEKQKQKEDRLEDQVINLDENSEDGSNEYKELQRAYEKQQIMLEELKQHAAELEDLKNEAEVNASAVQKNFELLKNEYSALHKEIDLLKTANSRSEKSVRFFMTENTQLKNDLTYYKQELKTMSDKLTIRENHEERRRSKDFEQQLETVNKEVRLGLQQKQELEQKLCTLQREGVSVEIQTLEEVSEKLSLVSEEVKEAVLEDQSTFDKEVDKRSQPLLACYPVLVHKRRGDAAWDKVLLERSKSLKIQAQHLLQICGKLKSVYGQLVRVAQSGEPKQISKLKDIYDETFKLLTELIEDISLDADTVAGVVAQEVREESEEGGDDSSGKRAKLKKRKKKGDQDLG